ncbi:unnamed protein product [Owenia fusiformis]|uniref:Uncharacterized protein n=1 Tax=Owenia fusiformis TaxID=6347 RepID=A0A8J1XIC3_OWEFU|nr:unnamed protein product [Owenia fusiformis]
MGGSHGKGSHTITQPSDPNPQVTPLMRAVQEMDLPKMNEILDGQNANIDTVNGAGQTALDIALLHSAAIADADDEAEVKRVCNTAKLLLAAGASKVSRDTLYTVCTQLRKVDRKYNPLVTLTKIVAENSTSKDVKELLLQVIIWYQRPDLMEMLIKSGADTLSFWLAHNNMTEHIPCHESVSYYESNNLIPPHAIESFIKSVKKSNKAELVKYIVSDMAKYPTAAIDNEAIKEKLDVLQQHGATITDEMRDSVLNRLQ